jgi:hypothetical protein
MTASIKFYVVVCQCCKKWRVWIWTSLVLGAWEELYLVISIQNSSWLNLSKALGSLSMNEKTLHEKVKSTLVELVFKVRRNSRVRARTLLIFNLCILDLMFNNWSMPINYIYMQSKPLLRSNNIHFFLFCFALSNVLASSSLRTWHEFDIIISNEPHWKTHQTHH